MAEFKKDVKIGDSIKLENNRAECYSEVAVLTEDVEICKNISFGSERNKISCINKLVLAKNDFYLCSEHQDTDLETDCIYDLAIKTKNIGTCLFVGGDSLSSECIAEVAKKVKKY